MSKKIEKAWEELKKLPEDKQEVAANAILDYTVQADEIKLSDEQVIEIENRIAEEKPTFLTLAQVRARFKHLGA